MKIKLSLLLCALLFVNCAPRHPEDVVSEDDMENILHDYFMSQSIASLSEDSVDYRMHLYTDAVLKKYDLSRSDFDRSMRYYSRHSDQLYEICKRISERYNKDLGRIPINENKGFARDIDSIPLWCGHDMTLLSSQGVNKIDFTTGDSLDIRSGDRLALIFDGCWNYPAGERSVIAVLSVTFANGKGESVNRYFYNEGDKELSYYVTEQKIKRIRGLIYQDIDVESTKPHLLFITHPRLVCIRKTDISKKESL